MTALMFLLQRGSAVVLAFAVTVHLATIIYAVRGGLTAAEILERLRGSYGWMLFYTLFVLAVAIHAPIGLKIGSRTPEEVAIAIAAQIVQVMRSPKPNPQEVLAQ